MIALLTLVACKTEDPTFFDGFGVKEEAVGSDAPEESPLGPYVRGSTIHVYARPTDRMRGDNGLELFSTDADVLEIVEQTVEDDYVAAEIEVTGGGEARIELWKGDWNLGGTAVVAHENASPHLLWAPGVLSGRTEVAELGVPLGLVAGGTATFQIAYEDSDGNPVLGSGLGSVLGGPPALTAVATTEYQGRDGDWIELTAVGGSMGNVEIRMDALNVGAYTFGILADPASAILALYAPREDATLAGDTLFAAALAFGSDNAPFYGVPATWELEGDAAGEGEVFAYTYDPDENPTSLAVKVGGLVDQREIRMGEAHEGTTCASAPRSQGAWLALLGALLTLRRARSRPSDRRRR
jgi:hypothetical protein